MQNYKHVYVFRKFSSDAHVTLEGLFRHSLLQFGSPGKVLGLVFRGPGELLSRFGKSLGIAFLWYGDF